MLAICMFVRWSTGLDDSIRQRGLELALDLHNPGDCWFSHDSTGHPGSVGTKGRARETAGTEKRENDLLDSCEFTNLTELMTTGNFLPASALETAFTHEFHYKGMLPSYIYMYELAGERHE